MGRRRDDVRNTLFDNVLRNAPKLPCHAVAGLRTADLPFWHGTPAD
jgi:hypothetical protein